MPNTMGGQSTSAMGGQSAPMGASMGGQTPAMGQSAPMGGQTPTAEKKDDYVWPVPKTEWALVPDSEADASPLEGEGLVSDKILAIEREGRGILYNAIHRDPEAPRASKPISEAIKGAQRMRAAMAERGTDSQVKFCLVTERKPFEFMSNTELCKPMWPECIDFAEKIKVFDTVLFYDDMDMPPVIERREKFQTWPELWVKRIMASLNSPFAETMVVDSDVYGCTKFEDLFDEYLANADVSITLAPAPFGASRNYPGAFRAGFPESYALYTERNLGLHILRTGRPMVIKLLALFRDVYVRQANDTAHVSIGNDQCAFREALWSMKSTYGVNETNIPADIGCRHETGCADGCLVVHRHSNPEMSRAELQELKKKKNVERKALAAEKKAAEEGSAEKDAALSAVALAVAPAPAIPALPAGDAEPVAVAVAAEPAAEPVAVAQAQAEEAADSDP
jgi:hypothetical protein